MKWQKSQIRKLYLVIVFFLITMNVISGCGATQPSEEKEVELEPGLDDMVQGLLDDISYYGDFYFERKAIEGEDMYCFTNAGIPDFEFLVDEEQTIGTVIYGSESITFPLGAKIFGEENGYGDICHKDITGDGIDDFVYMSVIYDKMESWKNSDALVWKTDTTIVDLKNMKIVEEEDVLDLEGIPERIPVTIVDCASEQEGTYRYIFQEQDDNKYGYVDLMEQHEIGEEIGMEITSVYVGNPNTMFGAVIGYGFSGENEMEDCIIISIPYYYDVESGKMKFAMEDATSTLTTGSYVYEAMMQEGTVVELPEDETEELMFYGEEWSETAAISYFFSGEWDIAESGQRNLYYVNYPNSHDKSAVYLITLRNGKGYLYAYLKGTAFQDEMGEWKYLWQVKEIVYTSEVPESLK